MDRWVVRTSAVKVLQKAGVGTWPPPCVVLSVGDDPVGAGLCPRTGLHGVSVPPRRCLRGQSPLPQCESESCGSGSLPANGSPRCISASALPPLRAEPAPIVWGRTLWERVSARERASTVYQCLHIAAFAGRARSHNMEENPVGAGLCPRTGLPGVSVTPHRRLRGQSPLPQCGGETCGSGSPRCISASAAPPSRAEPAPTV